MVTSSLFNSFKKLGFGFKKPDPQLLLIEQEKLEIEKKVHTFIESRMIEVVLDFMNSGYELTRLQSQNLFYTIENLSDKDAVSIFSKACDKGIKINENILASAFFVLSPHLEYSRGPLKNLYENMCKDDSFKQKLFNTWMTYIDYIITAEQDYAEDSYYGSKHGERGGYVERKVLWPFEKTESLLFGNIALDECASCMRKIKKLSKFYRKQSDGIPERLESILTKLDSYANNNCNKEIESLKNKIAVLYDGGQLDKLVAEENSKLINEAHVKNLPEKAKIILEYIKVDYLSLSKKLDDLTEEERFNVNNLWAKRIPEIINKYLRADPEFRNTMKNSKGESIEDLLISSLNNIHEVLKKIQETHTTTILNDMAVMRQYTKALR